MLQRYMSNCSEPIYKLVWHACHACRKSPDSGSGYLACCYACLFILFVTASTVYAGSNSPGSAIVHASAQWRQFEEKAQKAFQLDNDDEADRLWREALKRAEQEHQIHPGIVDCLRGLAALNEKRGNYTEAERLYELAMRDLEAAAGRNSVSFAQYMPDLAWLYLRHGKPDKAEVLFQRALRIKEECLGMEDPGLIPDLSNYAEFLRMSNRLTEANIVEQRARSIHDKTR